MKTLKEQIEVMQHFEDGGKIDYQDGGLPWVPWGFKESPSFNWNRYDYRIKKELRVIWVTHYDNGKIKNVYRSIVCGATKFIEVIE